MARADTPIILHLDASASGDASVSRELSQALVDAVAQRLNGARRVVRDLVRDPIGHVDATVLAALRPAPGADPAADPAVQAAARLNETLVQEFLAADVVVIGAPMINFSVPTQLKAWIDRVAQAGRTFRYTSQGAEGLAGGKQVIIVSSRGGRYAGTAFETMMDHQEAYLRTVFGFFGITDVTIVRAEGTALGPEQRTAAVNEALGQRDDVAARIASEVIARARQPETVA